ncbi:MAG: ribosome silencing factor [Deltaproteobacteria bacterium]|nr:ribosome silencing factor [Deltaproteobacteria bacterium]
MTEATKNLALEIVEAARSRKAEDVVLMEIMALVDYTDYLVICSGRSDRQVGAIADAIEEAMSTRGVHPLGVEGLRARRWVLLDFGEVVVHVFHEETREVYDLERLWYDAPRVTLPEERIERREAVAALLL